MYRIRVHSISANLPVNASTGSVLPSYLTKRKKVFLDICAETGQISRRILLGSLKCPDIINLDESLTHCTDSPMSLALICGNTILGRHTVIDLGKLKQDMRVFTFARRNTPVYKLTFSIEHAEYKYSFSLDTITCLKQNRWLSPDPLFAEVEFNHSPHNVTVQPTNRYWLGNFQQHDQSFAFSSHHRS